MSGMFPRLWKGLLFPVHQGILLFPHTPHHPQPRFGRGERKHDWITVLLPVGGGEGAWARNALFCACFWEALYLVTLQWNTEKQQAEAVHTQAHLHACAVPICACVLPRRTFRGALDRGAAWLGKMPEELLSALSLRGFRRLISIWVRAYGAAPAGMGEVTLRGHTWTWLLYCTAQGTKPTCVGHVPSCVTLWLSAAVMGSSGVTQWPLYA